ncbi:MAG: cysteine synthase A [Chloroflexota bacterium]|nr:cysteine synthase A [Dehalococcoidia bacterium]MDW8254241.1 cysteine synthase A [Chloroflexota bacterium]
MNRPSVAHSVLDLIGRTPLVRLGRLSPSDGATIYGKLESANPAGSVKDRIALAMIEAAEACGALKPGDTIVEPTSGNTGIGLAMVAAVKGYRLILTMPEDMSLERRRLLARFGAELVLTPAIEGMTGAVYAAEEICRRGSGYFMPQQFVNAANPEIHYRTTGPELAAALDRIDAFVAGVGTGGTITGVARYFREQGIKARIIAVEPARSPVLQGGRFRPHAIQGIGASFVPGVLDRTLIDEIIGVRDEDAIEMTSQLTRYEGLLVGISSGANVWAARQVARRLPAGACVVTILCDTGERYLTVPFTDEERIRPDQSKTAADASGQEKVK